MCHLRPLRVIKIEGNTATLDSGIKAIYDKKVGKIEQNDKVLVYGNLIIHRVKRGFLKK